MTTGTNQSSATGRVRGDLDMMLAKKLAGTVAVLAFAGAAIYSVWFKGYSPLQWPVQLAWQGFQTVAAGRSEKVWMVAQFTDDKGQPMRMSFNNPAVPNMTLAECKTSIDAARPHILEAVRRMPGASAVTDATLTCVASDEDPIRP
jgi:hypothetical protein